MPEMNKNKWFAERFEENRSRLRAIAYRMLGSTGEADDAFKFVTLTARRRKPRERTQTPEFL